MQINLTYFFLGLLIIAGCKKPSSSNRTGSSTDNWNAKYVGNYKGTWTSCPYGSMGNGPLTSKDTILSIWADQDPFKNFISLGNVSSSFQFDTDNTVSIYHGYIKFTRTLIGLHFIKDSLFYSCGNGGLGGGVNETFKGKKL